MDETWRPERPRFRYVISGSPSGLVIVSAWAGEVWRCLCCFANQNRGRTAQSLRATVLYKYPHIFPFPSPSFPPLMEGLFNVPPLAHFLSPFNIQCLRTVCNASSQPQPELPREAGQLLSIPRHRERRNHFCQFPSSPTKFERGEAVDPMTREKQNRWEIIAASPL